MLELHAREKMGLTKRWRVFRYEMLPLNARTETFRIHGAIPRMFSSGSLKGRPNFMDLIPGTELVVEFSVDEHARWIDSWERRKGKCSECRGEGKTSVGYTLSGARITRPCRKCDATGKPTHRRFSC